MHIFFDLGLMLVSVDGSWPTDSKEESESVGPMQLNFVIGKFGRTVRATNSVFAYFTPKSWNFADFQNVLCYLAIHGTSKCIRIMSITLQISIDFMHISH